MNSAREFNDLTINLKSCRLLESSERIEVILQKFNRRIKKFKFWCSVQNECAEVSETQLVKILDSIPDVQELILRNICVKESRSSNIFKELNLLKLRQLTVDYCLFDTPSILNRIPRDVLSELVFTFDSMDETYFQKFFNQQTKIKKLELFENDKLTFDHLQLEHLKISSGIDFVVMLSQQPRLRYLDFAITWIDDDTFAAVCKLKNLEVLKMLIDQVSCREFKNLTNMTRLKELRIDSHDSFDRGHFLELSMMHCSVMEKLTLVYTERKIPEEILIQISLNFRKLKNIELINRSLKIATVILEHFPNLESMLFDFFAIFGAPQDILEVSDDLKHENLKQLVVTDINCHEVDNTISLIKLVNACPNLERIMLSKLKGVTCEDFKNIFELHPKLTHLSLEFEEFKFDYDIISILKDHEKNLVHLRLNGLTEYPSYSTFQTFFHNEFPIITRYKYSTGEAELIMKKRNTPDWHLNFKLMDHF
jgi:hypothetical protein